MFFLYSIQVDTFDVVSVRVEQMKLKLDFITTAYPSSKLAISIKAYLPDSQLIFLKNVIVDYRNKTSVAMNCEEDQVLDAPCNGLLLNLKKNIKVDITFEQANYRYTIHNVYTPVDTYSNTQQIAIIVGCSVGGVVIIALLVVFVILLKRRRNTKHLFV
ncbi:Hypothetical_protein [Hexamita inflata]|uniref:Hypothetical_protein n=1 Tax=Hexamita inflata TaxID=28002 RepID=A0AA86UQW4_9EUKA|nr:Hypothetical protein HINF_LOCUS48706 [Hexamita inflata]